jgi:peroxiredoxin
MSLKESLKLPLGTEIPAFTLTDANGNVHSSDDLFGEKGLLVVFTCNHCPYANAVWPRVINLAHYARGLYIETVAINPNIHPDYPDDAPDKMIQKIEDLGIDFPYLVDETQEVAKAFKAQCTPDIYLFDGDKKLAYHGRIDDNWKEPNKVTREELKAALVQVANGEPPDADQKPSMGCSIKWK